VSDFLQTLSQLYCNYYNNLILSQINIGTIIVLITFHTTTAPTAASITQMAQIYGKDQT
jgi:hypothetical protein